MIASPTVPESIADGVYIPYNVPAEDEGHMFADLGYGDRKTDPAEKELLCV
jgi:hypothetical protein